MSVNGGVKEGPPDPSVLDQALQRLAREVEERSRALPPSIEMLKEWGHQLDAVSERVEKLPGKPIGLLRNEVEEVRDQIQSLTNAREKFFSQRHKNRFPPESIAYWSGPTSRVKRNALSAAIHDRFDSRAFPVAAKVDTPKTDEKVADSNSQVASAPPSSSTVRGIGEDSDLSMRPAIAEGLANIVRKVRSPTQARSETKDAVEISERQPRQHSTRVDPIMAIEGRLANNGSFVDIQDLAVKWLRKKHFQISAPLADSFELEVPKRGHRALAVSWPNVWALQVETADTGNKGRRWRVEMVLVDAKPTPAVSVTLTAISPAGLHAPEPSVPGLAAEIIQNFGLLDSESGELLSPEPTWIDTPETLFRLVASLQSPDRNRPVLVLSTYSKGDRLSTLMDPNGLAKRLHGLAKVCVLSRQMSWLLTDRVSKRFTVAGATVRLFRPGFSPEDDPARHPSWDPSALEAQSISLSDLSQLFLKEAAYASLRALEREDAIPAFERVREQVLRRQIDLARKHAKSTTGKVDAAQFEVRSRALERAVLDADEIARMFEAENDQLRDQLQRTQDERDLLQGRTLYLQNRIDALEHESQTDGDAAIEFPSSWDRLEDWCDQYLGTHVFLTAKAIRAAKNSDYLDVAFAYEVLWFLATTYHGSKTGRLNGGINELNSEKARLGIEVTAVGKAAQEKRSRDTYSGVYKGEHLTLDAHVKGSSDRDPRHGFRVYFHWHAKDHCVVVGWLPSHLDNGLT